MGRPGGTDVPPYPSSPSRPSGNVKGGRRSSRTASQRDDRAEENQTPPPAVAQPAPAQTHRFEPTKYGADAPCGRTGCNMPAANRIHFHTLTEIRKLLAAGPDGDQRLAELAAATADISNAELGSLTGDEHDEWLRRAQRARRTDQTATPRPGETG